MNIIIISLRIRVQTRLLSQTPAFERTRSFLWCDDGCWSCDWRGLFRGGRTRSASRHCQGDDVSYVACEEIDESASKIVVYGMVSRSLTSLGRPTVKVCVVSFQVKAGYMVWSMSMIPASGVLTDNTRVKEAAPIREGWSGKHRGTCLVDRQAENDEVIGQEGHDVQRVTELLSVEFDARRVVAKETMSVILQVARKVDESTSDVVFYGMMPIFPDVSSGEAHEEIKR